MHVLIVCTVKRYSQPCRRAAPGQTLALLERVRAPKQQYAAKQPANMPAASQLAVAFEDDHLACIVKPQGIPTQASTPTCSSIVEAVHIHN